ncbi:hypothetical protein ACFFF5_13470 [Lederbergia wuyishanensis]|uniref:Uncharacterized protein n=1 Tax=Lederbergia wuyishanensis TaxID=1347903 RepID=A0ABU0D517_9BACI|nr:hypothetical protein [Lederbergia wuyishanensis]MCJ8009578.1 hypothetical protein [Lederbergia wuyishanensis]MDQ0343484.1 hypothetical protein [Lederbergia wuyishanensis]
MSEQNQDQLLQELSELKEMVKKLESDVEDIKFFTKRPIFDSGTIGTVGGLILGALAIIGIFW